MKKILILSSVFVLIAGVFTWFNSKYAFPENRQLIINCLITDEKGKILRTVPGLFCDFSTNGDYISSDGSHLFYFNRQNILQWKKDLHIHHQIKFTPDEKRILLLSSDFEPQKDKTWIRWDRAMILDLQGQTIASTSIKDHLKAIEEFNPKLWASHKKEDLADATDWIKNHFTEKSYELFHTNSIYEIGPNLLENQVPWMKRGNILLNLHGDEEMILVLDPSLQHVEHLQGLADIYGHLISIHDVQLLPNSNLLIYTNKNIIKKNGKTELTYSSIDEIDAINKKIVWRYTAKPLESFYSKSRGGVTLNADETLIFNDETTGEGSIFWVNRNGEILRKIAVPMIDPELQRPAIVQEVKPKDLRTFLKNHIPL